jgi:hypothetical protein
MSAMPEVRLLFRDAGYGLTRDAQVIVSALKDCTRINARIDDRSNGSVAANIFLEIIDPQWLESAKTNILIPNPEWLRPDTRNQLGRMDYVLCKTRDAERIFRSIGCRTHYCGFSGTARIIENSQMHYGEFLHLGGQSPNKGTQPLIDCWSRRPDWPMLRAFRHNKNFVVPIGGNIDLSPQYLPDGELRLLQNGCGVHLCPSQAEGYGHTIIEGMSVGAVVITTNAPPMNEIVALDRGLLVETTSRAVPVMAGMKYEIDLSSLEQVIDRVVGMDHAELRRLGLSAREWYKANDKIFRERIVEFVLGVV